MNQLPYGQPFEYTGKTSSGRGYDPNECSYQMNIFPQVPQESFRYDHGPQGNPTYHHGPQGNPTYNHVPQGSPTHNHVPQQNSSHLPLNYATSDQNNAITNNSAQNMSIEEVNENNNKRRLDEDHEVNIHYKSIIESAYDDSIKTTVYYLLMKTFRGRLILMAYHIDKLKKDLKFKYFEKYVHKLARIVIDNEFIKDNVDIRRDRVFFLRDQICALFPTEIPVVWYSPSFGIISAKCYLYGAYKGLREASLELNIIQGIDKDNTAKSSVAELSHDIFKTDVVHDTLKKNWASHFDIRKKSFKSLTIAQLLALYPCLGCSTGYELIEADFEKLYPKKSLVLIQGWPEIAKKILKLAIDSKENSDLQKFLNENANILTSEKEVLAFFVLIYLIKASKNVFCIRGLKLTSTDFVKAFIIQTKDYSNLDKQDDFRVVHECVISLYNKVQSSETKPYIIICGELDKISALYVVLRKDHKYKVQSLVHAVDIFLKIAVLIKTSVSKFFKHIVQFFEYHIFEISNKGVYHNVLQFTKSLNCLENL